MRYVMKEKLWSFTDSFAIKNEAGEDVAIVDGKAFSFSEQLAFKDAVGRELALIKQVVMAWGPTYEIYREGQLAATVKRKGVLRTSFSIDVPGPDDLVAEGSFTDHEYTFVRGGQAVAQISKQVFAWSDTYAVDVLPGEDAVLILATAVVIDMVVFKDD